MQSPIPLVVTMLVAFLLMSAVLRISTAEALDSLLSGQRDAEVVKPSTVDEILAYDPLLEEFKELEKRVARKEEAARIREKAA